MKKIIHHIRKQPEHIRRYILHIVILACAVVLFLFWIYSLGTTLTNGDIKTKTIQDLKPFSILKDNIVDNTIMLNIKDSESNPKQQDNY